MCIVVTVTDTSSKRALACRIKNARIVIFSTKSHQQKATRPLPVLRKAIEACVADREGLVERGAIDLLLGSRFASQHVLSERTSCKNSPAQTTLKIARAFRLHGFTGLGDCAFMIGVVVSSTSLVDKEWFVVD